MIDVSWFISPRESAHSFPRPLPSAQPNYSDPNLRPAQKLRFSWTNPRPDPRSNRAGLQPKKKKLLAHPNKLRPNDSLGLVASAARDSDHDPNQTATRASTRATARRGSLYCFHVSHSGAGSPSVRLDTVQTTQAPSGGSQRLFGSAYLFSARFPLFRPSQICFRP